MVKRTLTFTTPARKKKRQKTTVVTLSKSMKMIGSVTGGPLGLNQKAQLIYSTKASIAPNGTLVYSLNSVYDPFVALGGHQPRGLDQLFAMFDAATVIGTRFEIWAVSEGEPVLLTVMCRDSSDTITDYRDALENGYSKHKIIGPQGTDGGTIMFDINPNKYLGRSHPLSDPQLKNSAVNGPAEQLYCHIHNTNMKANGDTGTLNIIIKIAYTTIFHEPKTAPIS